MFRRLSLHNLIWFVFFSYGCVQTEGRVDPPSVLTGRIMGTYYRVTFAENLSPRKLDQLANVVEKKLTHINRLMSTYRDDSEISRFNRFEKKEWFDISKETAFVVSKALEIHEASGGRFDITVSPLVELWGFGKIKERDKPPAHAEIEQALRSIGSQNLKVRLEPPAIRKAIPELEIDLSAIAKGFAVDLVFKELQAKGITNFLVDIGGEIRASGSKTADQPWQVAIESPVSPGEILKTLPLVGGSLATSGNYRNFFEFQGNRYSHTIDPQTGYPAKHSIVSVSVIANDCLVADAWATAFMISSAEESLDLAEQLKIAALIIQSGDTGSTEFQSKQFSRLTNEGH